MDDIVLVGFGGHAKSVADCIEREGKYHIVGYTDSEERKSKYKYLGADDILQNLFEAGVKNAVVGIGFIGKGGLRERIYNNLKRVGFNLPVIIDPSAVISDSVNIDEGSFIGKCAVVNAGVEIGKMVIINTKALVEHGCQIGDFSHVSVAAVLCGQVKVGKSAFIGANSTVIQCREIKENQIVPAGETIR